MDLVEVDHRGIPTIRPEVLGIKVFKDLMTSVRKVEGQYEAQKRKGALYAIYIYYMEDYRSGFRERFPGEENEKERHLHVEKNLELECNKFKDELLACREFYREHQDGIDLKILDAATKAAHITVNYFNNIDYDGLDANKQTNLAEDVIKKLKTITNIIADLEDATKRVKKKLSETKLQIHGGGTVGPFEDPK